MGGSCAAILADRDLEGQAPEGVPVVLVEDVQEALGKVAAEFYGGWGAGGRRAPCARA